MLSTMLLFVAPNFTNKQRPIDRQTGADSGRHVGVRKPNEINVRLLVSEFITANEICSSICLMCFNHSL